MSLVSRKTLFLWCVILVAAFASAWIALRTFPLVVSGLAVEITLSREQVLVEAERLHQQLFPALKTTRQAVQFVSDRHLQNYVELEGGGLEAFQTLITQAPDTHYWKVRHFSEGQQDELVMAFSPAGSPISYNRVIPEQAPGAALDEAQARQLAEAGASAFLGDVFTAYALLETRQVRQASGRIDHVFTYEHQHLQVEEARFRLSLRVAGDQLVAVDTYKHIPQAFDQRFAEMRGVNNQIGMVAAIFVQGLFLFGGGVLGCFWLYRRHQLRWRGPLVVALVIAVGAGLAQLSFLPSAWMNYPTTDKASSFLLQQYAQALLVILAIGLPTWVSLMAAEGLSRMAFAGQVNLFQVWRRPHAASPQFAGQVLGGYAWAGFFLLYAVLFILFSSRVLGWWSPAFMQNDPNLLASWRPALSVIFTSLNAGVWEEALFRAIPLALAALIGRRFGIERGLVIFTLIFQAVVFAAAHANYPQLPGYSRVVELFIPAIVFGLVYLRYGLIPVIVSHVVYDLVLFGLPIFWADTPGLWIDRTLVILVGLLPLLVLIGALVKERGWVRLAEAVRHGEPPAAPAPAAASLAVAQTPQDAKPLRLPTWLQAAFILLWLALMVAVNRPTLLDWPLFTADRQQALAQAEAILTERDIVLEGDWRRTITSNDGEWWHRQFVWPNSGAAETQRLLGTYLDVPLWKINWRRFDGPVEERAEVWEAWLYPDGQLKELVHRVPEGRSGASLSRDEALVIARDWVVALGWPDPATLQEKSVEQIERPARTDWKIVWLDLDAYDYNQGQAAIQVYLSGDEVTGYRRLIEVPEHWGRSWNERTSGQTPFKIAAGIAVAVLLVLALLGFIGPSSGRKFSFPAALPWMLLGAVGLIGGALVSTDAILSQLDPTQDWKMQVGILVFSLGTGAAIAATLAFFAAQAVYVQRPLANARFHPDLLLGVALALALSLGYIAMETLWPSSATPGPNRGHLDANQPWLAALFTPISGLTMLLINLLLLLGIMGFLKARWRLQLVLALGIVWFIASCLGDDEPWRKSVFNLLLAIKLILAYQLIRRSQLGVAMVFLLVSNLVLVQIQVTRALYPDAAWQGWLAVVFTALVSYWLVRHWYRHQPTPSVNTAGV